MEKEDFMVKNIFTELFKFLRVNSRLAIDALAMFTGISHKDLLAIERGVLVPSRDNIDILAEVYGLSDEEKVLFANAVVSSYGGFEEDLRDVRDF